MSDFLSNLVMRSVFDSAAVRPHQQSIFEPLSPAAGAFFGDPESREKPSPERNEVQTTDRISQLQSLWQNAEAAPFAAESSEPDPASSKSTGGSPEIEPHIVLAREDEGATRPGESRARADAAEVNEDPRAVSDIAQPRETPNAARPPLESRPIRVAVASNDEGLSARAPDQASESVAVKPARDHAQDKHAKELVEFITPVSDRRRVPTQVQAQDLRALPSQLPSRRPLVSAPQPEGPPVAPSINVTIGRVEVRAILPAAPSKEPRASAPVLNLDEYLRQRAKGNRK